MSAHAAPPPEALSRRAEFKAAKTEMLERFRRAANVASLMHALSKLTDEALKRVWDDCGLPATLALVAPAASAESPLTCEGETATWIGTPQPVAVAQRDRRVERSVG